MIQTVIDLLTEARLRELEAIDQYMTHHYEMENKGLDKLATKIKQIAAAKMKHAEKLAERVLFLRGEPISKPNTISQKGQEIPEMLATDIVLERQAIKMYNEATVICTSEKDQKSKELFEELLSDEEGHLNFFENIKNHVDKLGAAYIATFTGK
ncbi:MAG: ferritin-like domain-containing protein [Thermodesulfobacteriota bacterium]